VKDVVRLEQNMGEQREEVDGRKRREMRDEGRYSIYFCDREVRALLPSTGALRFLIVYLNALIGAIGT